LKKLLVVLLIISVLSATALSEEDYYSSEMDLIENEIKNDGSILSGDFLYQLLPDGTASFVGYYGNVGEFGDGFEPVPQNPVTSLTIPSVLDGYPVTRIGEGAFYEDDYITSIEVPEGVTAIEDGAFEACTKLTSIHLPDSLSVIGGNPFVGCTALKDIILFDNHPVFVMRDGVLFSKPDKRLVCYLRAFSRKEYSIPSGTEIIGDSAFEDCGGLKKVSIPNTVTRIGNYSFCGCESLDEITIPDSVTAIGEFAFCACTRLTEINLPDSILEIGINPFAGCKKLKKVLISTNHPLLEVRNGSLLGKQDNRLISFPCSIRVEEYSVPEGTETIGDYAFSECRIERIILPDTVTTIGNSVFCDVYGLTSVTVPASVVNIGSDAFYSLFSDNSLTVIVEAGSYAEAYCKENEIKYAH